MANPAILSTSRWRRKAGAMSTQRTFAAAVTTITTRIAGRTLDDSLRVFLDENFPPGGEAFDDLAELCRQGVDEGWLCDRE